MEKYPMLERALQAQHRKSTMRESMGTRMTDDQRESNHTTLSNGKCFSE
jgi:hypothetical protein